MEWKMYGGRSEVRCRYGCACCGTCVACYLACCCIRMLLSTLWCTALRHTSRAHATRGGLAATCKSQHAGGHLRKMHHHSTRQGKNPIRQANWVQHCISLHYNYILTTTQKTLLKNPRCVQLVVDTEKICAQNVSKI